MGIAYLVFVIYGSLVPLRFRPMNFADAWAAFVNIRYLKLGIGSRADWVANILLFIPLSFFWLGVFWPRRNTGLKAVLSAAVWMIFTALSAAIEFTQLFFPPRTVSLNDIFAEGIGAAIGVAMWWKIGSKLMVWLEEWKAQRLNQSLPERLLWLYLALLFGYNILPLDLTISPVEIYHKWKEGRLLFIPFQSHLDFDAHTIYELVTDAAIWLPAALLLYLAREKSAVRVWLWTVTAAILVEFVQVFVYTRVTDTTDIVTAMIGGWGGAWLGTILRRKIAGEASFELVRRLRRIGWGLLVTWPFALAFVFWYPFKFHIESAYFYSRLDMLSRVPFYAYYYGTEYRAITEVLHKVVFFVPLGGAVSLALSKAEKPSPYMRWMVIGVCGLAALVIELGQAALPGKNPDSTDLVLEMTGGVLGCRLAGLLKNSLTSGAAGIRRENHLE